MSENKVQLHLGCGKRVLPGFIHIDIADNPHINFQQSADKLPMYEDNTVDLIYASHMLEYFDRDEVKTVLKEWHRVLKPGGKLRLAVPDFMKLKWVYENTHNIEDILGPLFGKWGADTKIYHKTVYTNKSLTRVLEENGFHDVHFWDWATVHPSTYDDHSMAHFGATAEDIQNRNFEGKILISLNLEATK